MTRPFRAPILILVGAAALLAACSSPESPTPIGTQSGAAPSTALGSTTGNREPDATAATVADQDRCTAGELSLNPGRPDGSAGSVTIPLVFTNTGGRTCTLYGFPGVSYVDSADGTEIGAAATRSGDSGTPIALAPGERATAMVRAAVVLNYPAEECSPTPVAGLRVYPPNDSTALFVAHTGTGCAGHGVDQLQVTAVTTQ